ncbi:hypothetical protein JCM3770_001179 [Rhodotorula araucariae]
MHSAPAARSAHALAASGALRLAALACALRQTRTVARTGPYPHPAPPAPPPAPAPQPTDLAPAHPLAAPAPPPPLPPSPPSSAPRPPIEPRLVASDSAPAASVDHVTLEPESGLDLPAVSVRVAPFSPTVVNQT